MKKQIKKWLLRITTTTLLIAGLLLVIVLNPLLTYAGKTTHGNYSIYHNKPLDSLFTSRLDEATALIKTSEFYNGRLHLDICLNDGSVYPALIRKLRGRAFAWGFYNKVVLQGTMNCAQNYVMLNGYKWNLSQLLAHEMIHCLQFDKLGFWGSKPVAKIPNWKWEGYAEYIARQHADQKDLARNLDRLQQTTKGTWGIAFADGTIAPGNYYSDWLLVQYCIDIRQMTYDQLLRDKTSEAEIRKEMLTWFAGKKRMPGS